jgi:hypothetical protein
MVFSTIVCHETPLRSPKFVIPKPASPTSVVTRLFTGNSCDLSNGMQLDFSRMSSSQLGIVD